jgi:hypothetical protein
MRHIVGLAILGSLFLSSCGDYATIWSTQLKSPAGRLVASAETIQNGGPGTAYVDTEVYLKQPGSSQQPVLVLGFSNDSAYPSGHTAVQLRWLSESQLDVKYKSGATLDFQAVKALGATITAHQ